MNYSDLVKKLEEVPGSIGHKPEWNFKTTNYFIFWEDGYVKVTTRDWPEDFIPSYGDKKRSDWIWEENKDSFTHLWDIKPNSPSQ